MRGVNMNRRIQLTEEYAREILDECACTETCDFKLDETISVMKQKGYILKSDLQQKVEEAEVAFNMKCGYIDDLHRELFEVIQLLKQSHPEFKK